MRTPKPHDRSMNRRSELDLLRVIAIAILLVYHVGMMFNRWDWHLKNPDPLPVLEAPMAVLHRLRMPLLMVIAGAATAIALERRSIRTFAVDRIKRLLVPLLYGMLVIVPPQIYVERLAAGYTGSYFEFYPSVFEFRSYPEGSFGWHHLWFVAYLFVYCMVALPVFYAFATAPGRRVLVWLDRAWARGWVFVLFVPLALARIALRDHPETHALVDDPDTLVHYAVLFVFGHLLGRSKTIWDHVVAWRWRYLAATGVLLAVMAPLDKYPPPLEQIGETAMIWCVILTTLGWGRWFFQRPGGYVPSWLDHAQKLSYPFYIVHQTVIVVLGWGWMQVAQGPWQRFAAVLVSSFLVTWAICELIARVGPLRPLFGMAPSKPTPARVPRVAPSLARVTSRAR
ncbi:MAG: acyltransferase [Deltaproteobacteria bacterium]|nr:MAG: acyltransferase [Deltaproteobacteria bacterium]TMQ14174.1 MAG: acyltransferase [Deltaproteobacteria bacterium]